MKIRKVSIFTLLILLLFINSCYNEPCTLMRNVNTNEVDCFGCANGVCKKPSSEWIEYDAHSTEKSEQKIGIPYNCYETENGCELVQ